MLYTKLHTNQRKKANAYMAGWNYFRKTCALLGLHLCISIFGVFFFFSPMTSSGGDGGMGVEGGEKIFFSK